MRSQIVDEHITAGPYDKPISKIHMESAYGAVIWSGSGELAGPSGVK
jgi:hypothetical protein